MILSVSEVERSFLSIPGGVQTDGLEVCPETCRLTGLLKDKAAFKGYK